MKAVITTLGKFHSFDLARQLHRHGALAAIYSGYPRFKLRNEGLPESLLHTFPYVHGPYMASGWRERLGVRLLREWEYWDRLSLDRFAAATLPEADVFVGLSGCGLATGALAKHRGMRYVCDRGSTHIRHRHEILSEEYARWNLRFPGTDPRVIEREEAEYAQADLITVPSQFVKRTFLERGVAAGKVRVLPYGVDLRLFEPIALPPRGTFNVLFAGGVNVRKGIPYLLQAFQALGDPRATLTLAGAAEPALIEAMARRGLMEERIKLLGHLPQRQLKALMSRSHVLVLPSIEEGLAAVMAQAMACGCPVIATRNTGADDLFSQGKEGFIVKARDVGALVCCLHALAGDPDRQERMRDAALRRVSTFKGWQGYGDQALSLYRDLAGEAAVAA